MPFPPFPQRTLHAVERTAEMRAPHSGVRCKVQTVSAAFSKSRPYTVVGEDDELQFRAEILTDGLKFALHKRALSHPG
jgi:hypothetical protein